MKGCYVLLLRLEKESSIAVGRLGRFQFPPGYYAYVGSAMTSLERRVARHLREDKRRHWHLDYLLELAKPLAVFKIGSRKRCECALAKVIEGMSEASTPVRGFGSSDCSCGAHLFHFAINPERRLYSSLRRFSRESNLTLSFERLAQ
jgi:Uri superfamily endonuclease